MVELVRHALGQDSPEVQAVACEGVAKLMLAGMISDDSVGPSRYPISLRQRLMAETGTPIPSLALLLSRDSGQSGIATMLDLLPPSVLLLLTHQPAQAPHRESRDQVEWTRVAVLTYVQIFSDTFTMLSQLAEEFEGEEDMLALSTMGLMMVDWLDPEKAV